MYPSKYLYECKNINHLHHFYCPNCYTDLCFHCHNNYIIYCIKCKDFICSRCVPYCFRYTKTTKNCIECNKIYTLEDLKPHRV